MFCAPPVFLSCDLAVDSPGEGPVGAPLHDPLSSPTSALSYSEGSGQLPEKKKQERSVYHIISFYIEIIDTSYYIIYIYSYLHLHVSGTSNYAFCISGYCIVMY